MGLVVVVSAMAGCRDDGPDDPVEAGEVPRSGNNWGCRTCPFSNSPVLGLHPIEEFHLGADPVSGFRLIAIRDPGGTEYLPELDGDLLVANKAGVRRSGSQLVGWSLVFQDQHGASYEVEMYTYQTHEDWASGKLVDTYSLVYDDGGEPTNVCPGLDPDETSIVLIPGETYDLASNTVVPKQSGWVTVACRGHALAKMKLLGYDPADTYGSTADDRQATLRMITADYCGDGTSFTQLGQPLDWADLRGSFPIGGFGSQRLEAKFDADGAICIDTPRHARRKDVEAHCGTQPYCNGDLSFNGATWVTQNP